MGHVLISGGAWCRRKVRFHEGTAIRPTPVRLRHVLFNWFSQTMDGLNCLDLFAGSGILGFEALSRQARGVTFLDRDFHATMGIREALSDLGVVNPAVSVIQDDSIRFLKRLDDRSSEYDVVFVDPPFAEGALLLESMALLQKKLLPGSVVYVESPCALVLSWPWCLLREKKVSRVFSSLWRLE